MATPKLDSICIEFIKRIPTTFQTAFTAGNGVMPDTNFMPALNVIDYVNWGMKLLFNEYWKGVKGDPLLFSRLFPELVKYSGSVSTSNGLYTIANPYLDFKRIIGAIVTGVLSVPTTIFAKVWDDTKFTIALSGVYDEYTATSDKPAIIQMNNNLYLLPDFLSATVGGVPNQIKIHYIALPVDPTTGLALVQNGNYDCPFSSQWNSDIANYAYQLFLQESYMTV